MSKTQDDDVSEKAAIGETKSEIEAENDSTLTSSPGRALRSSKMSVIEETDESLASIYGSNNNSIRKSGSASGSLGSVARSLEAHAEGTLQNTEDAKENLVTDETDDTTEKSISETSWRESTLLSTETMSKPKDQSSMSTDTKGPNTGANSETNPGKGRSKLNGQTPNGKTTDTKSQTAKVAQFNLKGLSDIKPKTTGTKSQSGKVPQIAGMFKLIGQATKTTNTKRQAVKGSQKSGRFKLKGQTPKTTDTKSQEVKGLQKDGSKRKIETAMRRYKPGGKLGTELELENLPKTEGKTSTDTTHDENFKQDRSDSSLDFKLTNYRDNSDNDQECDSSTSTNSGSGTTKTSEGILENEKGNRIISVSRYIFFAILGVSAFVIAGLSFWELYRQETNLLKEQFAAQAEELNLYTTYNIESVFDTLAGLSASTTSLIKRQVEYPPGFINVPDVAQNLGLARNSSSALVIAYMPKVLREHFDLWDEYSTSHSYWLSDDQPGGPVDLDPIITPYVWEFTDYEFEDTDYEFEGYIGFGDTQTTQPISDEQARRATQDIFGRDPIDMKPGLRGINPSPSQQEAQRKQPKLFKPPGECSATRRRRGRKLAETFNDDVFRFEQDDDAFKVVTSNEPVPSYQDPAPRDDDLHTPVWQISPVPIINNSSQDVNIVNYNLADRLVFSKAVEYMERSRAPVFLDVCDQSSWFLIEENRDILQTVVAYPVFQDFLPDSPIVGYYTAIIPWEQFFLNNLRDSTHDIIAVMKNSCRETFTVRVSGEGIVTMLNETGDSHDETYTDMAQNFSFAGAYNRDDFVDEKYEVEICIYELSMYPTRNFENAVRKKSPYVMGGMILIVFVFTSFAFMLFDCMVTRRQNKLLNTALRQNAIVNSLFPKNVQRKLMEEADATLEAAERNKNAKRRNLTTYLNDDQRIQEKKVDMFNSKPIADLFPNTTIMFADISGFTAWSSAREPAAVFTLLETIYRAFDDIAKRRRVFKVEVVGDCYVAVCGLPDPRKDHYAVMCRFAQDCMAAMHVHTKELEVRLGPDTGDLSLRVGLHSGPVVAGVLRGEKSRFQLFGDTMNTASRMESTGVSNRIQLSSSTADLLTSNGKEHWIIKRQKKVRVKGKGELTTYFLLSVKKKTSSTTSASASKIEEVVLVKTGKHSKGVKTAQKRNRVADWVVEMLGKLLKEMKAKRKLIGVKPDSKATIVELEKQSVGDVGSTNKTVIDEVAECLELPGLYKSEKAASARASKPTSLDKEVIEELQHYVYSIASLYQKNPFHNFEHASHVSMSCIKLLNRIASHDEEVVECSNNHTYGICSDPLTSFGIVFSALIHDVDHSGVPNAQLVKEHSAVATMYKNKSVAEQNSIDVGWGLLMEPTYANLRRHIYTTAAEYKCFRQIVVNCIMATDICDKDLIKARNKRWDLAFTSSCSKTGECNTLTVKRCIHEDDASHYRKATVVIEHLIQLSDVSHTMQHWHMYRRWNERLFEESYKAYVEGRAEKDPSENWYQGELGFYDFYIIPLAKKIKQCAVFGVSSDEYLSYALANREEWEERGKEVVKDMVTKIDAIFHAGNSRQVIDSEIGEDVSATSSRTSRSAKSKASSCDESEKGISSD